jgi:hypothetical protein
MAAVSTVGARFLLGPATGDLDLAIGTVRAITDDEMIGAALEPLNLPMLSVDLGVAARRTGAVVDHDVPPGPFHAGWVEKVGWVIDKRPDLSQEMGGTGLVLRPPVRGRGHGPHASKPAGRGCGGGDLGSPIRAGIVGLNLLQRGLFGFLFPVGWRRQCGRG